VRFGVLRATGINTMVFRDTSQCSLMRMANPLSSFYDILP